MIDLMWPLVLSELSTSMRQTLGNLPSLQRIAGTKQYKTESRDRFSKRPAQHQFSKRPIHHATQQVRYAEHSGSVSGQNNPESQAARQCKPLMLPIVGRAPFQCCGGTAVINNATENARNDSGIF